MLLSPRKHCPIISMVVISFLAASFAECEDTKDTSSINVNRVVKDDQGKIVGYDGFFYKAFNGNFSSNYISVGQMRLIKVAGKEVFSPVGVWFSYDSEFNPKGDKEWKEARFFSLEDGQEVSPRLIRAPFKPVIGVIELNLFGVETGAMSFIDQAGNLIYKRPTGNVDAQSVTSFIAEMSTVERRVVGELADEAYKKRNGVIEWHPDYATAGFTKNVLVSRFGAFAGPNKLENCKYYKQSMLNGRGTYIFATSTDSIVIWGSTEQGDVK